MWSRLEAATSMPTSWNELLDASAKQSMTGAAAAGLDAPLSSQDDILGDALLPSDLLPPPPPPPPAINGAPLPLDAAGKRPSLLGDQRHDVLGSSWRLSVGNALNGAHSPSSPKSPAALGSVAELRSAGSGLLNPGAGPAATHAFAPSTNPYGERCRPALLPVLPAGMCRG